MYRKKIDFKDDMKLNFKIRKKNWNTNSIYMETHAYTQMKWNEFLFDNLFIYEWMIIWMVIDIWLSIDIDNGKI